MPRVLGALSSRGRLLAYALATLAVLLAAALFVMRTIASRAPSFDLVVEMEAPRQAQRLQATFNNDRSNTRRLAIEDGRRAYIFSDIPADPKSVRLDWVGEPGLRATFYGIEFRTAPRSKRSSGTRLVSIDPQTWPGASIEGAAWTGAGRLAATSAGPMLLIDKLPNLGTAAGKPKDTTRLKRLLGLLKAPMAPLVILAGMLGFLLLAQGPPRLPGRGMADAWPWLVPVLILAVGLRLPGIWWSVPTNDVPMMSNLDEIFSLNALNDFNPFAGKIVTDGYREGMLFYYISGLFISCLHTLGLVPSVEGFTGFNTDYGKVLAVCRVMMLAYAAGSVALVFLIVLRVTGSTAAAAVAGTSLAVAPFPVVYALTVRAHEAADFFLLLVAYFSLDLIEQRGRRAYVLVGVLLGLAISVRFNMMVALGLPLTTLAVAALMQSHESHAKRLLAAVRAVASLNVALMIAIAALVWLVLHPGQIFAIEEARRVRADQLVFMGWGSALLSQQFYERFARYLTSIFPTGARPLLWVLFYVAAVYALTLRRYWTATIPLTAVGVAYLGGMVWSFPFGFLRTLLPLFPIFAVLTGIAFAHFWETVRENVPVARTTVATLAVIFAVAGFHALAYRVSLMGQTPRQKVLTILQAKAKEQPRLKIGALDPCKSHRCLSAAWDAFHPVADVLRDDHPVEWFEGPPDAGRFDYVVVSHLADYERRQPLSMVAAFGEPGGYAVETVINQRPSLFGVTFSYKYFPWEMGMHFPIFYVLRGTRPGGP